MKELTQQEVKQISGGFSMETFAEGAAAVGLGAMAAAAAPVAVGAGLVAAGVGLAGAGAVAGGVGEWLMSHA